MNGNAKTGAAALPPAVDVVVLGGGMVGASLAVALSSLDLKIAVVEARSPGSANQPSYDDRATAVSNGSQRILATMGVWEALAGAATPIRKIHVSESGRFGATRIDSAEQGVAALGYVVENRVLGRVLWRRMEKAGNVFVVCPSTLGAIETTDHAARIACSAGSGEVTLAASLAVAADGAQSRARALAGIDVSEHSYDQCAVIANVTSREPHRNTAYERFTVQGPLAFLPMSNGRSSVVWTVAATRAAEVMRLDDKAFLRELQRRFGYRLGHLIKTGERHSYPLSLVRAESIVARRIALVGNAAHGLHPVAGQGFNLGLRDVAALADVIADASIGSLAGADDAGDAGTETALARYEAWRTADHQNTIALTDGLVRAFTNPFAPVRTARSLALVALDAVPAARAEFARRSMGLDGRLPRLARGVALA